MAQQDNQARAFFDFLVPMYGNPYAEFMKGTYYNRPISKLDAGLNRIDKAINRNGYFRHRNRDQEDYEADYNNPQNYYYPYDDYNYPYDYNDKGQQTQQVQPRNTDQPKKYDFDNQSFDIGYNRRINTDDGFKSATLSSTNPLSILRGDTPVQLWGDKKSSGFVGDFGTGNIGKNTFNFGTENMGKSAFDTVFNNMNRFGSGESNSNFTYPLSSKAQEGEGEKVSAEDLSKYLGSDYNVANWMQADYDRGVRSPLVSAARYFTKIAPLVKAARDEDMRNAFAIVNNPKYNGTQEYNDAMGKLAYYTNQPDLLSKLTRAEEESQYKMGKVRNPDYSGGDSEYGGEDANGRYIYSYFARKGIQPNVIAAIMGNLQQESGFNHGAFNPDDGDGHPSGGIAQWHKGRFGGLKEFAAQRGTNWNDLGTQLDYIMHEINRDYPELLKQMSNMSPYDGALFFHKVFERSNDSPEMAAQRGKNAANIFNGRKRSSAWMNNPNAVTERERFEYLKDKTEKEHTFKAAMLGAKNNAKNGVPNIKLSDRAEEEIQSAFSAYNGYLTQEGIDDSKKKKAEDITVQKISNIMKNLVNNNVSKDDARAIVRKIALKELSNSAVVTNVLNRAEGMLGDGTKTDGSGGNGNGNGNGNGLPISAAEQRRRDQVANSDLDDVEDLERERNGRRIPKYYENGQEVSEDYWNTLRQMGANREKNLRKYAEERRKEEEDFRNNINERRYVD